MDAKGEGVRCAAPTEAVANRVTPLLKHVPHTPEGVVEALGQAAKGWPSQRTMAQRLCHELASGHSEPATFHSTGHWLLERALGVAFAGGDGRTLLRHCPSLHPFGPLATHVAVAAFYDCASRLHDGDPGYCCCPAAPPMVLELCQPLRPGFGELGGDANEAGLFAPAVRASRNALRTNPVAVNPVSVDGGVFEPVCDAVRPTMRVAIHQSMVRGVLDTLVPHLAQHTGLWVARRIAPAASPDQPNAPAAAVQKPKTSRVGRGIKINKDDKSPATAFSTALSSSSTEPTAATITTNTVP